MTEVIKTRSDADFLGLVPLLLGFRPQNSVVLIGFRGRRTHGALRLDLPDASIGYKKVAAFALGTMSKIAGLESIAVVVYTDTSIGSAASTPHEEFVNILTGRIERSGLGIKGVWCLGADGWVSYDDSSREVRSTHEIELSDAALSQPHTPGLASATLPAVTEEDKRRMSADLERYQSGVHPSPLDDVALFVEQALEWNEEELREYGSVLLFLIQQPDSRNSTMLQWASSLRVGESMWSSEHGTSEGADLMLGRGPRPQRERIELAVALLTRIAALAGPDHIAPPLCMLAWLHWAVGQGSIGGQYLDQALDANPKCGLATLLQLMMSNGYLPPWAFDEGGSA